MIQSNIETFSYISNPISFPIFHNLILYLLFIFFIYIFYIFVNYSDVLLIKTIHALGTEIISDNIELSQVLYLIRDAMSQ